MLLMPSDPFFSLFFFFFSSLVPADPLQHEISAKFIFDETHSQAVESKCRVRSCYKLPTPLGPLPSIGLDEIGGWGCIPSLDQLGFLEEKAG